MTGFGCLRLSIEVFEKTLSQYDLLPRIGHGESRKSGWVEIHKIVWQTALSGHHPATNAVGRDYSPVSRFRSFLRRLQAT